MNPVDIGHLLSEMKVLAAKAKSSENNIEVNDKVKGFGNVLKEQVEQVNELQMESAKLQERFSLGDPSVTLPQVMVATQKAGINMQFLVETRNKVLSAYTEIMNMTI